MMNRDLLLAAGIDYEDGLYRFMNNPQLYEKFIRHFLEDPTFGELRESLARADTELAFRAAHTLKGVAGNLSLRSLLTAVDPVVEALRSGDLSRARELLPPVEAAYDQLCAAIRAAG